MGQIDLILMISFAFFSRLYWQITTAEHHENDENLVKLGGWFQIKIVA
mgnify:FL=1